MLGPDLKKGSFVANGQHSNRKSNHHNFNWKRSASAEQIEQSQAYDQRCELAVAASSAGGRNNKFAQAAYENNSYPPITHQIRDVAMAGGWEDIGWFTSFS
jgi:hypothetical protein